MEMYVAHTYEIDEPQKAVQEILQALPPHVLHDSVGKSTIGIVTTHTDAIETGVVAALAQALPFDCVGMTTLASSGDGEADLGILTLTVLMSEKNTFITGISSELQQGYTTAIDTLHSSMQQKLSAKHAMTLVYAPFSRNISGQEIVSYLTGLTDNTPLFGGLASDHTGDAENAFVLYNGQAYKDALVLVYIEGPLKPRFMFASLDPDELQNKKATVTASEGNTVFTINDMPVINYIYSLGLSTRELTESGTVLPFLVDYHDGSPLVAREALCITSEGHISFGGEMPKGASIFIALQTPEDVLGKAQRILESIEAQKNTLDGVLVVSCAGRSVILGGDPLGEAHAALQVVSRNLPYHQLYARGEICPVTFVDGRMQNRYHNFTFTVCMFDKL